MQGETHRARSGLANLICPTLSNIWLELGTQANGLPETNCRIATPSVCEQGFRIPLN